MNVKNIILYQIATDRNYKVGDIIEFGKDYNYQAHRVFTGDLITRNENLKTQTKAY